jgi:hypothetical protein
LKFASENCNRANSDLKYSSSSSWWCTTAMSTL